MFEFSYFCSFPAEIHSMILSSCDDNDRTCLSLTCKYLYDLNPIGDHVSLSNIDEPKPLCSALNIQPDGTWSSRYRHRLACHDACYAELTKQNERSHLPPPKKKKCTTGRGVNHCECYSKVFRLYKRLRTWAPRGLSYCGECDMFTRRKKQHNRRCFHGRGKRRRCEGKFWTHRARKGAFGRYLWRKWFNNAAMNRFESKLRSDRERGGTWRYDMRMIEPKDVDTRDERSAF